MKLYFSNLMFSWLQSQAHFMEKRHKDHSSLLNYILKINALNIKILKISPDVNTHVGDHRSPKSPPWLLILSMSLMAQILWAK